MSSDNNNNNNTIATTIVPTTPTQDVQANVPNNNVNDNNKYRGWSAEFDIALLEEVGNCGAHIPGHHYER